MLLMVMLPLMMTLIMAGKANYCSISKKHTMCQTKVRQNITLITIKILQLLSQGLGQSCGGGAMARGVGEEEILQIVDSHNR